jgi:hypothetical protein
MCWSQAASISQLKFQSLLSFANTYKTGSHNAEEWFFTAYISTPQQIDLT